MKRCPIRVLPESLIYLSFLLLTVPVRWLLSWMAAAILHELFHILALKVCGFRIGLISVCAFGAKIETDMECGAKAVVCALAGPLAGFFLLLFAKRIPMIALCGMFQSMANLLPMLPLDGGRAVRSLLLMFASVECVNKISKALEWIVWIVILAGSFYGLMELHLGLIPLFCVLMLFLRKKYLAIDPTYEYNRYNVYKRGN